MKSKYVILASALLISVIAFAQKDQIKTAEKALKAGNPQEAVSALNGVESLIANAEATEKAHFYSVNGNAHLELANKKVDESKNLLLAAKSFQELLVVEKASGKDKYSSQAAASIVTIKRNLLNSAIEDTNSNRDLEGAKKLYDVYLLDKRDTINLYYAASTYASAKDYTTALQFYSELKTLNFSGKMTNYIAVNKANKEEDMYPSAKDRDFAIKIGTHEKPKTEITPSKRGQIYKNIALILADQGKTEEAKKAIADARKLNPEDNSLLYTEANLYLETKDFVTYKKLVAEALEKNPNDADLVFNLGVLSANAKNRVDAEKYYKRVMEINPKYINAYINLAGLILDDEKPIIDEMNKLGTAAKDMKRYDVLKVQREDLFKSTIPYLKTAFELDPQNIDVAKTLLNVYSAVEMTTEQKELKEKIKALENK